MLLHSFPRLRLAIAALTGFTLVAGPAASQAVQVGTASTVTGEVTLSNAQTPKPKKIRLQQRFAWGDTVRTGSKSQLQILLLDRSSLTMGSKARLTIDRFVYDPSEGRNFSLGIAKGAFRFMSGRRDARSGGRLNSPSGSIGIRGTAVDIIVGENAVEIAKDEEAIGKVRHDEDSAMLVVLRGPGAATEGGLTPGAADVTGATQTVSLTAPSFAAYIPRSGAEPIGPFRISPAGLSRVQDLLAPNVARANGKGTLEKLLPALGIAAGIAVGVAILSDGEDDPGTTNTSPNNSTADDAYCRQNPNSPDCQ